MNRMDRLNQLFKREIGSILMKGEISDPRVSFVTLTYADLSRDLSYAHIGFSVLNDDPDTIRHALAGLTSASGRIRHLLAGRIEIKHMPEIKFVYDDTIAMRVTMGKKLDEIRQERAGEPLEDGDASSREGQDGQ